MARITVEDCKKSIDNRFELIIIAAHRAREISLGSPTMVSNNNDKDVVLALKEIANNKLNIAAIKDDIIKKNQKFFGSYKDNRKDFVDEEISELFAFNNVDEINKIALKDGDIVYQDEETEE